MDDYMELHYLAIVKLFANLQPYVFTTFTKSFT